MAVRVTSWLSKPSLVRALVSQARLAVRLMREPRVRWFARTIPLLATLYVISPLDIVPDVFPLVGQVDDLSIILIALQAFIRLCPAPVVEFHRGAIAHGRPYVPMPTAGAVIDAEFRRED